MTPTPQNDQTSSAAVTAAVIGGVFVVVAAVVGAFVGWVLPRLFDEPSNPTDQLAVPIRIDPVSEPVPRCATFAGDGDVPDGRQLWIVIETKEFGQTKYYFNETKAAAGRWAATNVVVGSDETPPEALFPVLAVTFSDATSADISTGRYQNGVTELFPDAIIHNETTVERGTDKTPCW